VADLLSIGVSGLRAFQRALDVTGHNIANASTPGYNRQRVEFGTREPGRFGSYYSGSGVDINAIGRVYDELLNGQARGATSALSRLQAYADKAQALSNLFADSSTGISATMQRFMNAVQGVANEPGSTAARQVMLSEADGMRQRLQTYDRRLNDMNAEINSRLIAEASGISSIATRIANLNAQIVTQTASSGEAAGDLLDARDGLINELSSHLNVSVTRQADGAWNVFVGNGQALVLGTRPATLAAQPDVFDPDRMVIAYQTGGAAVDMSAALSGGSLGGMLDFRREMLDGARSELGRIAAGVATIANEQHREGQDLYGDLGGDLFTLGGVETLAARTNSGSAVLSATRVDVGALSGSNYKLSFDGSTWSLQSADTGSAVALAGTGAVADPLVGAGLSIVVSGAVASGDAFLVRPTSLAISAMQVAIKDPARIAAAAPIRTSAEVGNTGSAVISSGEVVDVSNPLLRSAVALQFIDATHYSVNGAGSFTYTPGAAIDINGWRVQVDGVPDAGDTFDVISNAGGTGDNRNALALSDMLGRRVLSGGTESINGSITRLVGEIGVATSQAKSGAEAQQVILDDVKASIDSVSGVNLDEEAANMIRFQQAYQAAAQIIRATQEMFDTLMRATGR
jgi:flagellar hook-associated protein 1 FlgK